MTKTRTERLVFSTLSQDAKEKLADEIARWGLTIWHSTYDDLRGYWLETKSFETFCHVLRTVPDGAIVGCTTIKLYRVDFDGTEVVVAKLGLGVDPRHRGNKFALRCLLTSLLSFRAKNPRVPLYLFSTLIHPVTYKLCCDLLETRLYPYYKNPENPEAHRRVEALTKLFGVPKSDAPSPYVYKERFSAIETEEARQYWMTSKRPEVQFFLQHCPTYYKNGDCLICLARIDLGHTVALMTRTLLRNQLDRFRGRKPKFAST